MTASPGIHRVSRLVGRVVSLRQGDGAIALLMFAYSFLAMASYNILKPLTRSKFISDLGSDNLLYVLLAGAVVIGLLRHWTQRRLRCDAESGVRRQGGLSGPPRFSKGGAVSRAEALLVGVRPSCVLDFEAGRRNIRL